MELSKYNRRAIKNTPWISKCLDEYFAPGQFIYDRSHLVGVKWRADGCYAVLLFEVNGHHYVADVAGTGLGQDDRYEVCNDSENMTLEQWKGLKVDPYCDGFTLAEERA